ncbi:hypothetical protein GGI12_002743, partial [Dipsacomyces acuminosporus]
LSTAAIFISLGAQALAFGCTEKIRLCTAKNVCHIEEVDPGMCTDIQTPGTYHSIVNVVLCTAYSEPNCHGKSMAYGAGQHVYKPNMSVKSVFCREHKPHN